MWNAVRMGHGAFPGLQAGHELEASPVINVNYFCRQK